MKIFEHHDIIASLYQRALGLVISKEFFDVSNNKISDTKLEDADEQQPRRELLEVEQQAQKNKIIKEHGRSHFKSQVTVKLHSRVDSQVKSELFDKQYIFSDVLNVDNKALDVLEILTVKAASIKRITPLAESAPWLTEEIIKLVNKPQYRKRADVQVTDPSLALSYIGLDNLKQVIPLFILKHWLPPSTSPFPLMKRKLWNDSLAIAMASQVLAKKAGEDEYTAYVAGMFSNIGSFAVTRCVLNTYNGFHIEEVKEAYKNKDKKLHDILTSVDGPVRILHRHLLNDSANLSADLIEMMPFDRVQITEAMFDLANMTTAKEMCPIAQIVLKAKAYITLRTLAKEELITQDEIKALLSLTKLSQNELTLLNESEIDHIKLNFN